MKIKVQPSLDVRITIALEVHEDNLYLLNKRNTNGIKLFVRSIDPPRLGLSSMNERDPSIYIPFFINEWELDLK